MFKREKRKIILFSVIMILLMGIFWIVLRQFEGRYPSAEMPEEFLEESSFQQEEKAKGTITLAGKKYKYYDEFETYLFIGTDGSGNENGKEYQGSMADFLLLAAVNKSDHTYGLIQLNRDTMTEITLMQKDGSGMASADIQLCTAHWYGGTKEQSCENTVQAVSKLLGGIPIHGYYSLNMEQIPLLNHSVGGVTVKIEDDFSRVDPEMKKGEVIRLNDKQAYLFVHDRYQIEDGENANRMRRQMQYMKAFFNSFMEKSRKKPEFVNTMYKTLEETAVTDITGKKVSSLFREISEGENKGILTLSGKTKVGQALGDGILHTEFYVQKQSLTQVMTKLYHLKE